MNYLDIKYESKLSWLPLEITFPYEEMLQEAINVRDRFVNHRDQDVQNGYAHQGWKSLCIHGLSAEKTNHYTQYGYKDGEDIPYVWTDIADLCPITTNWLKNDFPMGTYYRVRFMLLEPKGFIAPHKDMEKHQLSPINLALNNPEGCFFKMENHGSVPLAPGKILILDVANLHGLINKSGEDRYHIIIHGSPNDKFKQLVEESYSKLNA